MRVRIEWGLENAERAIEAGAQVLVVVDVLSFCTTVATAVGRGGAIVPYRFDRPPPGDLPVAARRGTPGRYSLSPLSFDTMQAGETVVLPSPNGSTCAVLAERVPHVYAGALVNASAVARAAATHGQDVTIVACGEEGRFALEDHLGAAAIAAALEDEPMPDAGWYRAAIRACKSGVELIERGFGDDVDHACRLDRYDAAPRIEDGAFRASLASS